MQPVKTSNQEINFTIEKGMSTSQIADLLEHKGIIKNSFLFKVYLKWKNEGSSLKAGTYAMHPGLTYSEVISKLTSGEVVPEDMIKFTIPEGYTVEQIAEKLSSEGYVNKDKFLKLANEPSQFHVSIVTQIPADKKLKYALEGYLFPETYELKKGSTEADIITKMLEETEKRLDTIPDWKQKLQERKLTIHQLLTVASLVEREVVVDDERPLVAGVIYNRLNKGMKLEIDATVQYLLGKQKERLYNKDLRKIDSPYNSYLYEGLPPGPIASPSIKSIQAALEPTASQYLFYVTKKDGSHTHLFAKTYKEHLNNIQKSDHMAK
ncbi:endolytic transglycosylase MltG [Paenibacillus sediminis]